MRRLLLNYYLPMLALFVLASLYKNWIDLDHVAFFLGGMVGVALPDIDHLIFAFYLHPDSPSSKEIRSLASSKNYNKLMGLFVGKQPDQGNLIFHNATFQWVFVAFSILVLTSVSNLFGRGLTLAFMLHLLVDQYFGLKSTGNLNNWFRSNSVNLTRQQSTLYWLGLALLLLFLSFLL